MEWPRQAGMEADIREQVAAIIQQKRKRRRARVQNAAAGAALLALLVWAVPYFRETSSVATLPVHRQTLALQDGSSAELNASTSLSTDFRYGRRTVRLTQGEAFFSVAHDTVHPFLVETPAGTVRVTGTKFNVRLVDSTRVEVTLDEGSVSMQREGVPDVRLAPSQQYLSGRSSPKNLDSFELENVEAWRTGELALDGLPMAEVAARLSAYHGVTITVAPEVAQLSAGGRFPISNLAAFLKGLQAVLPVRTLPQSDGSYRIVPR